jgi:large subunit ribosomal protein L25
MKKLTLQVSKRDVFGKKLKKLRREGTLPANIFGPDFKSTSITVNMKDFLKVYRVAHETGVVTLDLEKKEVPTLIKFLQKHPVSDQILHVDFRKIDLTKKVLTDVPVKAVGVSEAVSIKGGVLLIQADVLSLEALPNDIPTAIEIDISVLKEIGNEIKVSDLSKSSKYEFKDEADKVVISVVAHKEESVTPDTVSTAPEVTTEKVEGEAEGEAASTPEKGEAKPAGKAEAPEAKK